MGRRSDLPSFDGLVDHVYSHHHLKPDAAEQGALCRCEFDKALGLLARPERVGERQLRRTVIERLSTPATGPLNTHTALITLSSHGTTGLRLVTTNFDNRFIEAGVDDGCFDAAPKLPLPKPHAWASLVHLHGHISRGGDGANLVLTTADFGRAYLSEGWASRFVTELFREFTVVFVGYSLDDRVMSYLVDALAAERASGARFSTAYAFAPHDGTDSCREAVNAGWLAKNVQPILYDMRNDHQYLSDTLIEWARLKTDPFRTREQIVMDEMTKLPDRLGAERVTWALRNPVTAQALAKAPAKTKEQDYPKIEQWLERFHEAGLLSQPASDSDDSPARLVGDTQAPRHLGTVSRQLGRWMARHLHVPHVLTWVLQHGGRVHPLLRHQLRKRLADPPDPNTADAIPPKLRHMWTILCAEEMVDRHRFLLVPQHLNAASKPERRRIAEHAITSIAPRLVVRPGADWGSRLRKERLPPIESCAHLEVIAGDDDERHLIEPVLKDRDILARYADTLTSYLEHALSLLKEVDGVSLSVGYRPSIADHDRNSGADDWTHLVDLVRDSYVAVAEHDRDRARYLFRRWMRSPHPLFKRLALHILTDDPRCDIRLAKQLLLDGSPPGLWDLDMRREVLRFLRLAGRRLPPTLHTAVVRAIHATPESKNDYSANQAERAVRLHKLRLSGAALDSTSRSLADEWRPSHDDSTDDRDEFLSSHEYRWVGPGDSAPALLLDGTFTEVVTALRSDRIQPDEFMDFAIRQQSKAVRALRALADSEEWKAEHWDYFLEGLAYLRRNQNLTDDVQEEAAEMLLDAPDDLLANVRSVAGFVEELAEQYDADQEPRFGALWIKAWINVGEAEYTRHDPLGERSPAARLAQAACERLWKYEPRAGYGLPAAVQTYFDTVVTGPNGLPGRVVLASHLYELFTIDPAWTKRSIIACLDPEDSDEAFALWGGYAWSAKIGPNLLSAMEDSLLKMLERYYRVHDRNRVLIALLVMSCIDTPKHFEPHRVRQAVDAWSENALEGALWYLAVRLKTSDERASIWTTKVKPWLTTYWPQERQRNTARTADEMVKIVMESGSAFPDAVSWSLDVRAVQPIRRLLRLHRLVEPGYHHIKEYPDAVLQLLDGVVTQDSVINDDRPLILRPILDALGAANPALAQTPQFQKLQQFVAQ